MKAADGMRSLDIPDFLFIVGELSLLLFGVLTGLAFAFPVAALAGAIAFLLLNKRPVTNSLGLAVISFCLLWGMTLPEVHFAIHDIFIGLSLVLFLIKVVSGETSLPGLSSMVGWMGAFCLMILLSLVVGMAHGNGTAALITEAHNLAYYLLFFVVLGSLHDRDSSRHLASFAVVAAVLVAVQYLFLVVSAGHFFRVNSYHADLFVLTMPLTLSLGLFVRKVHWKVLCFAMFLLQVAALLVSFTRAGWVASGVGSAIVLLFFRPRRASHRGWVVLAIAFALVAVVFVYYAGTDILSGFARSESVTQVAQRAETMGWGVEDAGLWMRVELAVSALEQFAKYPILGAGLGDVVRYRIFSDDSTWSLDNTHLQILWKMGLVGFGVYIGLLTVVLKRSLYVFRRTDEWFYKWISGGIFGGFCGLILISFFSASLSKYNLNLVWAIMIAVVEDEAIRLDRKSSHPDVNAPS